ncbi:mCG12889 [Mus musculus]|nr:mCG12889 [Mus musculus]
MTIGIWEPRKHPNSIQQNPNEIYHVIKQI